MKSSIDWDAEPLGRERDIEIAARLGVSREAVRQQRAARGIPRAKLPPRPPASARDRLLAGVDRPVFLDAASVSAELSIGISAAQRLLTRLVREGYAARVSPAQAGNHPRLAIYWLDPSTYREEDGNA